MEGLQNLILPQSAEHIILLNLLLLINLIVFIPYLSILWGNLLLSTYCRNFCKNDSNRAQLGAQLINFMGDKRFFAYLFSFFPALGLLTIFAQLLSEVQTDIYNYLFFTAVFIFLGQFFVFRFQNSMGKENPVLSKGNSFFLYTSLFLVTAGIWLLFTAYEGIIKVSEFNSEQTILSLGFSISTISRMFVYLILSLALSSAFGIYKIYHSDQGISANGSIEILAKTALINVVILPVWSIIVFLTIPSTALSFSVFALIGIAIFLSVFLAILFYGLSDAPNQKLGIGTFYLFIFTMAYVFSADHMIIHNSTRFATDKLYAKAALAEAEKVKESMGSLTEEERLALGENIYTTICFACHQFDTRLVGPPYNEVLPKYADSPAKMKDYILNPVKIREDYPPMPAQPLKPHEAEAVVAYLLKLLKEENLKN